MTKPYYESGGITIYHGDVRDIADSLEFDVIVGDPPYGVQKKYGDSFVDTLDDARQVWAWMLDQQKPTAFTFSHTRLFDLPERPQWIGVWNKPFTGGVVSIGCSPSWEPVCFYRLPYLKSGYRRWRDVFTVGVEFAGGGQSGDHPTPRPVELMRQIINVMPDGVILDPTMGSGTTLRAAKDLGRRAIGVDVEERYCEIAAKRLAQEVLL